MEIYTPALMFPFCAAKENPRTHELAARMNLRRGRLLLALQAVIKMKNYAGRGAVIAELEDDIRR